MGARALPKFIYLQQGGIKLTKAGQESLGDLCQIYIKTFLNFSPTFIPSFSLFSPKNTFEGQKSNKGSR